MEPKNAKHVKVWKRIIWAIDPFLSENELQISAAWALRAISHGSEIEPVFILNESPIGVPMQVPVELVAQMQASAQDVLDNLLTRVKLKNLLPIKVISRPFRNQRELAQALIAYAKETGTGLIVASTHAKKGIQRFFAGSFVENLMLYCDVPLFVVNPHWNTTADFQNIVFPTDFSDESLSAFDKVLDLAQELGAEVTIFHQIPYIISPHVQAAFAAYPVYRQAYEEEIRSKNEEASKLAALANKRGVRASTYLDYDLRGSVAEAILKFAKKRNFIIAMAARSGKATANLLGSATRAVVRGAKYPVWVIHPSRVEQSHLKRVEERQTLII